MLTTDRFEPRFDPSMGPFPSFKRVPDIDDSADPYPRGNARSLLGSQVK